MAALFTTEDAPTHRRLALWQDIVCDVFVQLDCKSDLGTAFHGAITSRGSARPRCSTVSSGRQRVLRTPGRIARASEDFILIALGRQRRRRRAAGRPRDRDPGGRIRVLRHHPAL